MVTEISLIRVGKLAHMPRIPRSSLRNTNHGIFYKASSLKRQYGSKSPACEWSIGDFHAKIRAVRRISTGNDINDWRDSCDVPKQDIVHLRFSQ